MNLLLLLSALLSALTGGVVGTQRVPVAAEQMAVASGRIVAVVAARPAATTRFVETFDVVAALRFKLPLVRLPVGTTALYAGRLRE